MNLASVNAFNPFPNNKFLDGTKLKAFADNKLDNKLNNAKMMISVFDREENSVGKGENTCYQNFLLFPVFSKAIFFRVVESSDCVVKSKTVNHTILTFYDSKKEAFSIHCGNREKCWYPAFSPFPTMFSNPFHNKFLFFSHIYFVVCNCF